MGASRAADRAQVGTEAWRDAARAQVRAPARHADVYQLLGEVVTTLNAVDDIAKALAGQVEGYGRDHAVYDDSRGTRSSVDPHTRLREATRALGNARRSLAAATGSVNAAWSAIGHIGVELDTRHT